MLRQARLCLLGHATGVEAGQVDCDHRSISRHPPLALHGAHHGCSDQGELLAVTGRSPVRLAWKRVCVASSSTATRIP